MLPGQEIWPVVPSVVLLCAIQSLKYIRRTNHPVVCTMGKRCISIQIPGPLPIILRIGEMPKVSFAKMTRDMVGECITVVVNRVITTKRVGWDRKPTTPIKKRADTTI